MGHSYIFTFSSQERDNLLALAAPQNRASIKNESIPIDSLAILQHTFISVRITDEISLNISSKYQSQIPHPLEIVQHSLDGFQCGIPGFLVNLDKVVMAKAISGQVLRQAHIKEPMASWYGTSCIWANSAVEEGD